MKLFIALAPTLLAALPLAALALSSAPATLDLEAPAGVRLLEHRAVETGDATRLEGRLQLPYPPERSYEVVLQLEGSAGTLEVPVELRPGQHTIRHRRDRPAEFTVELPAGAWTSQRLVVRR
jgi:hypothetical protein